MLRAIADGISQLRLTAGTTFRRVLERHPESYLRWIRARTDRPNQLDDDSELLIDGFPSSANSYTRSWVHFANPDARIASHQHSSAVVRAAVNRQIPVVVPFREPVEAVTSMITRFPPYRLRPPYGPRSLLRWYTRYHEAVLDLVDRVVLVPFEVAIHDLTPTVESLNERFGTSFVPLDPDYWPEVEEYLRTKDEPTHDEDLRSSAPSQSRERAKTRFRDAVAAPELAGPREAAIAVHRRLVGEHRQHAGAGSDR